MKKFTVIRANSISRVEHHGPNAVRFFPDAKTFVYNGHLFGFSPSKQTIIALTIDGYLIASNEEEQRKMIMYMYRNERKHDTEDNKEDNEINSDSTEET